MAQPDHSVPIRAAPSVTKPNLRRRSDVTRQSRPFSTLSWLSAFVRLGRPQFLLGGFVMFALGAAMARSIGFPLSGMRCFVGQAVVSSIQLMTHYANDYFDYEADLANHTFTRWSGGSRVLPSGVLSRRVALFAALGCLLCALGSMAALYSLGATSKPLGLAAAMVLLAWFYSAPPLRLHSRGYGEIVAATIVGTMVPWFAFSIATERNSSLLLCTVPLVLLLLAMLLVIDLHDWEGDASVEKRTLVVRLGIPWSIRLHRAVLGLAYLTWLVWIPFGVPPIVGAAFFITAPLALFQMHGGRRPEMQTQGERERAAFLAVLLAWLGGLAEVVGFAVAT